MWASLVSQSGVQLLQFAKEVSTDVNANCDSCLEKQDTLEAVHMQLAAEIEARESQEIEHARALQEKEQVLAQLSQVAELEALEVRQLFQRLRDAQQ